MKTKLTVTQKNTNVTSALKHTFTLIVIFMLSLCFNNLQAQTAQDKEVVVEGKISDEQGPLEGATIIIKGTKTGTTTNKNGTFSFSKPLKTNAILVISYLGYETKEIKASEEAINLVLTNADITMMGALNVEQPYKSKRSK